MRNLLLCGPIKEADVSEFRSPLSRLAVAAAMAALLVLAGCGRKGPLDPPPGASAAGEPAPQSGGLLTPMASPLGGGRSKPSSDAALGPAGRPLAPKGPNHQIFLDGLLN